MVISNGFGSPRLKYLLGHCYYNILMQILDGSFTFWGTYNFGSQAEGNPLIRYFVESYGPISIIYIKLFVIASLFFLCHIIKNWQDIRESSTLPTALLLVNIIYTLVVTVWIYAFFNPHLISGYY